MEAAQAGSSESCDQWRLAEGGVFDCILKAQVWPLSYKVSTVFGEGVEINTWYQDGVRPVGQCLTTEGTKV